MTTIEVFSESTCLLGEAPVWSDELNGLFWLDILEQRLYFKRATGEAERHWLLPCICSAVFLMPDQREEVLLVSENGLARFSLESSVFKVIAVSHDEASAMRPNDAGLDPAGRIWFGTMQKVPEDYCGAVYCIDQDLQVSKKLIAVGIPNTFVWSADGKVMIHCDSMARKIYRSDFDVTTATLKNTVEIVDLSIERVDPDGSAMDRDGKFWNAQWQGARVVCYDMRGTECMRINVPALQPTSCAFGGRDRSLLYVTSAAIGLSRDDFSNYPMSGHVLCISLDCIGLELPKISIF